jgi:signal peptidase I
MNELGAIGKPVEQSAKRQRARDYLETIGLTILIALFLKVFVIEAYRIPTESMENTLLAGDFLLVNKFIYGAKTPRYIPFTDIRIPYLSFPSLASPAYGDVVVFEFPRSPLDSERQETVNFVKRLVAMPGDTVQIIRKEVFVNGRKVFEPPHSIINTDRTQPMGYRDSRIFPRNSPFNSDNYGPVIVPAAGQVLHLNDEPRNEWLEVLAQEGQRVSFDPQGRVLLNGDVAETYRIKNDYYFVMGDNRDNSLDSRFWGFVPDELIIGEALMVYWSWDENLVKRGIMDRIKSIRWSRIGTIVH